MDLTENDRDSESIYMNVEDAEKTSNQSEIYDNIYLNITTQMPGSTGACERRKVTFSNMAAVGLGLLCFLLLAVIIVLCIKHNKEMHQMENSYNNISIERKWLQSSYNNMSIERNWLQNSYNNINMEKNQLLNLNTKLTSEREQLWSSYNALKSDRDAMQKKLTEIDSCPLGWMRFLASCYFISYATKTFEESRQDCIRAGADLVIINSKEEQQFVSGLRINTWIGLTDGDQEGQWKWVDNTPLDSGYWRNNEPNNGGDTSTDEDCAQVVSYYFYRISVSSSNNWNDIKCNHVLCGLCEKKIRCSTQ